MATTSALRDSDLGQEVMAYHRLMLAKQIKLKVGGNWIIHELAFDELIDAAKAGQVTVAYSPISQYANGVLTTAMWSTTNNSATLEEWDELAITPTGGYEGRFVMNNRRTVNKLDKLMNGSYRVPSDKIDQWYALIKEHADPQMIVAFLGEENRMPDAPPRPSLFQKLRSYVK
jgi:hypothetical protein